jgi:predicted permease
VSAVVYRALLYLLPRDRRAQYGEQMRLAFSDVVQHSDGRFARTGVWLSEIAGLLRFAARERAQRLGQWLGRLWPDAGGHRPRLASELRWAWRAFVARGWRGAAVILLLATALAANAVVFSTADSFLLHRVNYPNADRLVVIGKTTAFGDWSAYAGPEAIAAWREFTDIFSAVYAHGSEAGATLMGGAAGPRRVSAASVEPGLLEFLGAQLVAGRFFAAGDSPDIIPRPKGMRWFRPKISIVSESLARDEFGGAQAAIGQRLLLGDYDTTIVGVIRSEFRFPTGVERIWTPLNLALLLPNQGTSFFEQLAPGVSVDSANAAVSTRAASVQARQSPPWNRIKHEPSSVRQFTAVDNRKQERILWLLFAAAGCLLLIACANVVNLELAAAMSKARTSAIALALGASPRALVAAAMAEGAFVVATALVLGSALAWEALRVLSATLPAGVPESLANPIDLDLRGLVFMAAIGAVTWLSTATPVAMVAWNTKVMDALRLESRSSSGSRVSDVIRKGLTGVEIAMSVCLLIGALLASRSYSALLAIPKGFNVAGVISIDIGKGPRSTETDKDLQTRVLSALRAASFVRYAGAVTANPPDNGSGIGGTLSVNGVESPLGMLNANGYGVDPEYFQAMGLPIIAGRAFTASDPPNVVVVDEAFANRVWPDGGALGATINFGRASLSGAGPFRQVIGIAAHLRNIKDTTTAVSESAFPVYYRLIDYVPLSFVARLSSESRRDDVEAMLRAVSPTSRIRVQFIRDRYARLFADEMLAAAVMNIFGVLALVVTSAGVYSVMAFLVAGRTREIGIRMALGADRGAITRMVVGSSARLVGVGALTGIAIAFVGARWGSTLLFGVSPRDPLTYGGAAVLVVAIAIIATWRPAFVAGRVDPSRLLRD